MSTRAQLKEKGYRPLFKGSSKTLPLYVSEFTAKKLAKDLRKEGFLAQAVKSGKLNMLNEQSWIVMCRRKG